AYFANATPDARGVIATTQRGAPLKKSLFPLSLTNAVTMEMIWAVQVFQDRESLEARRGKYYGAVERCTWEALDRVVERPGDRPGNGRSRARGSPHPSACERRGRGLRTRPAAEQAAPPGRGRAQAPSPVAGGAAAAMVAGPKPDEPAETAAGRAKILRAADA